jgi:TPR repeat protein
MEEKIKILENLQDALGKVCPDLEIILANDMVKEGFNVDKYASRVMKLLKKAQEHDPTLMKVIEKSLLEVRPVEFTVDGKMKDSAKDGQSRRSKIESIVDAEVNAVMAGFCHNCSFKIFVAIMNNKVVFKSPVDKNRRACRWLRASADAGNPFAQYLLGVYNFHLGAYPMIFRNKLNLTTGPLKFFPVDHDYKGLTEEAYHNLEGCSSGDARDERLKEIISLMDVHLKEAYAWFERAAVQGHLESTLYLINMSMRNGPMQSFDVMEKWIVVAETIDADDPVTLYYKGVLHLTGKGKTVVHSRDLARDCFIRSLSRTSTSISGRSTTLCNNVTSSVCDCIPSVFEVYRMMKEEASTFTQTWMEINSKNTVISSKGDSDSKSNLSKSDLSKSEMDKKFKTMEQTCNNFLKVAFDANYHRAIHEVAYCNVRGIMGHTASQKKAAELYLKSAELGNILSMSVAGSYYEEGRYVMKSSEMAYKWFLMGALSGSNLARVQISMMFKKGFFVKQDLNTALWWLKWPASEGFSLAVLEVGRIYMELNDWKSGLVYLEKAAYDHNLASAYFYLGEMYMKGKPGVVDQDVKKARQLWNQARDRKCNISDLEWKILEKAEKGHAVGHVAGDDDLKVAHTKIVNTKSANTKAGNVGKKSSGKKKKKTLASGGQPNYQQGNVSIFSSSVSFLGGPIDTGVILTKRASLNSNRQAKSSNSTNKNVKSGKSTPNQEKKSNQELLTQQDQIEVDSSKSNQVVADENLILYNVLEKKNVVSSVASLCYMCGNYRKCFDHGGMWLDRLGICSRCVSCSRKGVDAGTGSNVVYEHSGNVLVKTSSLASHGGDGSQSSAGSGDVEHLFEQCFYLQTQEKASQTKWMYGWKEGVGNFCFVNGDMFVTKMCRLKSVDGRSADGKSKKLCDIRIDNTPFVAYPAFLDILSKNTKFQNYSLAMRKVLAKQIFLRAEELFNEDYKMFTAVFNAAGEILVLDFGAGIKYPSIASLTTVEVVKNDNGKRENREPENRETNSREANSREAENKVLQYPLISADGMSLLLETMFNHDIKNDDLLVHLKLRLRKGDSFVSLAKKHPFFSVSDESLLNYLKDSLSLEAPEVNVLRQNYHEDWKTWVKGSLSEKESSLKLKLDKFSNQVYHMVEFCHQLDIQQPKEKVRTITKWIPEIFVLIYELMKDAERNDNQKMKVM